MPVVRFQDEEFRLGGACNVANNIIALGGRAELLGVVGDDGEGRQLLRDLASRDIGVGGIVTDAERCTTRKVRIVTTRNQQVARIDYESESEVSPAIGDALIGRLETLVSGVEVVVISDYLKGAISRGSAAAIIRPRSGRTVRPGRSKVPQIALPGRDADHPNPTRPGGAHLRIRPKTTRGSGAPVRRTSGCENVLIPAASRMHSPNNAGGPRRYRPRRAKYRRNRAGDT